MNTYIIKSGIINTARKARAEVVRAQADVCWLNDRGNEQQLEQARYRLMDAQAAEAAALASIAKIISQHQGRARERLLTAERLLDILDSVDEHLSIPAMHMRNVRISVDPNAQTFPASYRYIPESTHFDAVYTQAGWAITAIYRGRTSCPQHAVDIDLTDMARAAIITRATHISA